MSNFHIVHNIPTPYRVFLFDVLNTRASELGYKMRVHLMSRGHSDRPSSWRSAIEQANFSHTFYKDFVIRTTARAIHTNPGLVYRIVTNPGGILMVGGPWDSITGFLCSFANSDVKIAWIETNTRTPGAVAGVLGALKRLLLAQYDLIAVPGEEGKLYLQLLGSISTRVAILPNLVDVSLFGRTERNTVEGQKWLKSNLNPHRSKIAVWPARLVPAKGILPFLHILADCEIEGWTILILGDGILRDEIMEFILSAGAKLGDIRLLPYVDHKVMSGLYAVADLFILPSMSDPNPLSVVEALYSELPLLISDRLGNAREAVSDGENGWVCDPTSPADVRRAIRAAFTLSKDELRLRGVRSKLRAERIWSPGSAVRRFMDTVINCDRSYNII